MNNTALVISPHSFVDVITNSSSELFVCSTNNTLKAFKDVLISFVLDYNKNNDYNFNCNKNQIFEDIFKEPYIADYTFDLSKFNKTNVVNYKKIADSWYNTHTKGTVEYELEQRCNKLHTDLGLDGDLMTTDPKKYHKLSKEYYKQREKIQEPILKQHVYARANLYRDFLKLNHREDLLPEFDCLLESLTKFDPHDCVTKQDLEEKFNRSLSWEFKIKKGDIILESADDNSIPYEIQHQIESTFNAKRHHLG